MTKDGGPSRIRLGLAATDAMRIVGLQAILSKGCDFALVSLSSHGAPALPSLNLIVIDSEATDRLLEVIRWLRRERSEIRIIVLGASAGDEEIERVVGAGARGYLTYSAKEDELRMAIDVVLDGSVWAPRKVLARLLERSLQSEVKRPATSTQLTKRELEVLALLVLGQPNRQIANALGVEEATIKAHMGRLMRKAGVDNRTALSMRAIERHWA